MYLNGMHDLYTFMATSMAKEVAEWWQTELNHRRTGLCSSW